jgi:hypothetical protein
MVAAPVWALALAVQAQPASPREYELLATARTPTLEKEHAEAADAGCRFEGVMGGEAGFGGKEVVAIMARPAGGAAAPAAFECRLLATTKTGTMQKELSEAAEAGFVFKGVTVGQTAFGGREVVVVTERSLER